MGRHVYGPSSDRSNLGQSLWGPAALGQAPALQQTPRRMIRVLGRG